MKLTSKSEGPSLPCNYCDYKATRRQNLLSHTKSIHKGVRYPCDQCDYRARTKSALVAHKKSKHEGV